MAVTPYSEERGEFSLDAHNVAETDIYPQLFGVTEDDISFDYYGDKDLGDRALMDREHSIDLQCRVSTPHFEHTIPINIQERWRDVQYRDFQDVTVTAINTKTGTKSEHFKIASGYHLYGYYDPVIEKIPEAICFNVPQWQIAILNDRLEPTDDNQDHHSGSKFYAYDFTELIEKNVVLAYIDNGDVVYRNWEGWLND